MNVGEVAASAARDEDFFADAVGVIEQSDAASALAGFDGAHESGGACAEDEGVEELGGWVGQMEASRVRARSY